jgi:dihydrofolate reductase
MKQRINYTLVAAVSLNGVMGRDGGLPWKLPGDLQHFKQLTLNHAIIMGRKTQESLRGPLPERHNLVLSRQKSAASGFHFFENIQQIEQWCSERNITEVMVVGGAEIYKLFLPKATRMIISRVQAQVAGDTFFPAFEAKEWKSDSVVNSKLHPKDEFPWTIEDWQRLT